MKILHVCSNYFPAHGGPQYTMKHLSENFVKNYGDEVQVATTNSLYGPEMKTYEKIEPATEIMHGVMINRFPFSRWQYPLVEFSGRVYKKLFHKTLPHYWLKYRWGLPCRGIDQFMQDTDADVIMATTATYMFSDYPFWRAKTSNPKPFVLYGALHLHIHWPTDAAVIKRARACDCYIANTDFEQEKMVAYGVAKNKIVTIGTGIDIDAYACEAARVTDFRRKHGIRSDDILIGHVGRLSEGKGAGLVVEAFRKLYEVHRNCKLLLAGTSTPFVQKLKEIIARENLPVIILENFDNVLKPVFFHALDIFVLASKGESFGVVFLEAWACKKPVVGAAMGAIQSLVTSGKDGLLFLHDDAADLNKKLEDLVLSKEMREKMGKAGFEKTVTHYSWPSITKKYRDAYLQGIENFKQKFHPQTIH